MYSGTGPTPCWKRFKRVSPLALPPSTLLPAGGHLSLVLRGLGYRLARGDQRLPPLMP
eukprot:XP_001706969.1 Hypothetical protein GL50803_39330 [Giardia lamblia ATCC 50803]